MFTTEGEPYTSETITTHYSCGRIDVRGIPGEPYGDEIGVPPMLSSDWHQLSQWLDDVQTVSVWTLTDLVAAYEQHNPKITWDTYWTLTDLVAAYEHNTKITQSIQDAAT